jgi:serine phosphatase RsbU (regulator of sigma subunit)
LYDFVATSPDAWVVLIADVSSKGIPAAMALGSLRSAFRALAGQQLARRTF